MSNNYYLRNAEGEVVVVKYTPDDLYKLDELPIYGYACPEIIKQGVGFIKGEVEEQYQIGFYRHPDEPMVWVKCSEKEYEEANAIMGDVRILIIPVKERGITINTEPVEIKLGTNKPFIVANVREVLDQYDKEDISISRMTEMLNEMAAKFYQKDSTIELLEILEDYMSNKSDVTEDDKPNLEMTLLVDIQKTLSSLNP